jgi:3',5'-cyclic AMP phosphodiesterase CpdA
LKDNSKATNGLKKAIEKINRLKPDFVITGGDLVMDVQGTTAEKAEGLFQLYNDIMKQLNMPAYNTMGNHDMFGVSKKSKVELSNPMYGKKMYEKYFGKTYYSFEYKNWHFIILDPFALSSGRGYGVRFFKEELDWVKNNIAKIDSKTPVCIVSHVPLRLFKKEQDKDTAGTAGAKDIVGNTKDLLKILEKHNLKLVLQGHDHIYGAYTDNKNITYLIGGAICGTWWNGPCFNAERGFLYFKVSGDKATFEYMGYDSD